MSLARAHRGATLPQANGAARKASETALAQLAGNRIAIEGISPCIDAGRFPARAVAGEPRVIEADIFADGHDMIACALLWKRVGGREWRTETMKLVVNDRWRTEIVFPEPGFFEFTITSWRDLFATWRRDTRKKFDAGLPVNLETVEGVALVQKAAAEPASGTASANLDRLLKPLAQADEPQQLDILLSEASADLMASAGPRTNLSKLDEPLRIWVDRPLAAFGAWYEMLPRSQGGPGRHGTFDDVIEKLPYVRDLGFDILYFPPVHPIGKTNRKGRNNSLTAEAGDPGSPYAIGSAEGGHDAVHPELGTLEDFRRLVTAAKEHGLEIALDFAIQCSPDHPWIREHPEWFDWRPDGTIKFAENPPKKYEDIVNVHFYREAIPGLWFALRDIVLFWIGQGVTIFRVDNPHTKPFPFWEWMIAEVRARHPETIFLSEAFTRPKVMKRLAKVGFNQSYTYFTWRNTKEELTEYLTELTQDECRHTMRPNFFANTPDINPRFLQTSGRPGFRTRLVLAATLAGNYGVYNGYEICEAEPYPGKEEYLDSEKYQLRHWDFDRPGHIKDDIRLVNRLRHERPALRCFESLAFHNAWDDAVLYYSKSTPDRSDYVLFHVLLDPHSPRDFEFEVPLWEFGIPDEGWIEVEDLIHGNRFRWHGKRHRLWLDPQERPYAIWRLIPPGSVA